MADRPTMPTACAECGAFGQPNEYHPYALCLMVKASDSMTARANLNAVIAKTYLDAAKLVREHADDCPLYDGCNCGSSSMKSALLEARAWECDRLKEE